MLVFSINKYLLYERLGPLLWHDVQVREGPVVVGALVRSLLSHHLLQGYPFFIFGFIDNFSTFKHKQIKSKIKLNEK